MSMGVGPDCFEGSYRVFDKWRTWVCEEAGYGDYEAREGAGGDIPWPAIDPIEILLTHPDVAGDVIPPDEAVLIADQLEKLVPVSRYPLDIDDQGIPWQVHVTRKFILGLRAAAAAGESVYFW